MRSQSVRHVPAHRHRPVQPTGAFGRSRALDGMRALAVFSVVLFHSYLPWLVGGWDGVTIFFVVSGFLITSAIAAEHERTGRVDVFRFLRRRFIRLTPALFALLVAFCLWIGLVSQVEKGSVLLAPLGWAASYTLDFGMAFDQVAGGPLVALWSLAVEMQFYILWAVVLTALLRRLTPLRITIVVLALAVVFGDMRVLTSGHQLAGYGLDPTRHDRVIYSIDGRADALLLGAAAALGVHAIKHWSPVARVVLFVCGWVGVGFLVWFAEFVGEYSPTAVWRGGLASALATALVIMQVVVLPASPLARMLGWRPLAAVGRLSYSIYLWHIPVLVLVKPPSGWQLTLLELRVFQAAIYLPLAVVSYFAFERPYFRSRAPSVAVRYVRRNLVAKVPPAGSLDDGPANRGLLWVPDDLEHTNGSARFKPNTARQDWPEPRPSDRILVPS